MSGEPEDEASPGPRNKLFWFGALWVAGVATVSGVAYLIRLVIVP